MDKNGDIGVRPDQVLLDSQDQNPGLSGSPRLRSRLQAASLARNVMVRILGPGVQKMGYRDHEERETLANISESSLRGEYFNVFNHTNFNSVRLFTGRW